jgi:hypothetical protein
MEATKINNINEKVKSGIITLTFTINEEKHIILNISVSFAIIFFKKQFDITEVFERIFKLKNEPKI